jgi:hypothetical protein
MPITIWTWNMKNCLPHPLIRTADVYFCPLSTECSVYMVESTNCTVRGLICSSSFSRPSTFPPPYPYCVPHLARNADARSNTVRENPFDSSHTDVWNGAFYPSILGSQSKALTNTLKWAITSNTAEDKLRGLSLRVNYTERQPLVGETSANSCG